LSTATGTQIASATFTGMGASGWQTVTLATLFSTAANTGTQAATSNFFTSSLTNGTLTAPSSGSVGGNGYSCGGTNTGEANQRHDIGQRYYG
jgi:hypothetical protein